MSNSRNLSENHNLDLSKLRNLAKENNIEATKIIITETKKADGLPRNDCRYPECAVRDAIRLGHTEIIKLLLEAGADPKPSINKDTQTSSFSEDKNVNNEAQMLRSTLDEINSLSSESWVSFKSISFEKMPNFKKLYNDDADVQMELARYDNEPITKSNLFDAVITYWFRKSRNERMIKATLPSDGSSCVSTYFDFAGELAYDMRIADIHAVDKKSPIWNKFFDNSNAELVYARNACPLVQTEKGYEFIHPVLRDYFVARHIAKIEYRAPDFDPDFTPRKI